MKSQLSIRDFSMLIALAVIWGVFSILSPQFLGARNFSMLMIELSITSILALGMLLVIVSGQIDLSVGSGVGLVGGIASVLVFHHNLPAPVAMAIGVAAGLLLWVLMGALIAYQGVPAFIITLGGLLIFKGLFWKVIQNSTVPVSHGGAQNVYSLLTTYYFSHAVGYAIGAVIAVGFILSTLNVRKRRRARGLFVEDGEVSFLKLFLVCQVLFLVIFFMNRFRGIPLSFLLLGCTALAIHLLTTRTPFGRYLYAVGGNEEAARISGIAIGKVLMGAFAIMGLLVSLTGFMQTAYAGASTTTVGDLMELDAIAACVIGGASLKGGRGTVLGVIFGSLIMASLLNGMTLLAVPPEMKFIVRGSVLALAVWTDVRLSRRGA